MHRSESMKSTIRRCCGTVVYRTQAINCSTRALFARLSEQLVDGFVLAELPQRTNGFSQSAGLAR